MTAYRFVRPDTAFTGGPKKTRRTRDLQRGHLKFIRSLPCCVCGSRKQVEAAHVRMPSAEHGKPETGKGARPDDQWTVPLCRGHHQDLPDAQHRMGEAAFWGRHGTNPVVLALSLWCATGDEERAEAIIKESIARSQETTAIVLKARQGGHER